uniref:Uncharacterized protein n=1 Tax=Aureoumbra lagunensis TaxID=44058 RepID=A0A7S3JV45_9STRA|eukprot:CAMPEP_0197306628 /NCGR_PEP_ID=MMETSP0891-20130614/3721_1 /TAXON_ID=44058 ORGANISM="Aureoumbra lagunensis, Strain CCMP1510" /NCGR_SAMPLE_ID=MMETSP0891 /ASSEMBLY_ACC=CAM_ASM_000534 /LENGTH=600 /DNA_ID=CAMNT_0042789143 /DNA_START=1 /DNA_END=1803 /DNA_ORIENTATION=+
MTPKIVKYLVDDEACLELASFIALKSDEKKERIQDAENLERSYRAARALGASGDMLLPFLGQGGTQLVIKLCKNLLELFSPNSIGSLHHGCHLLLRLLGMYPDQVYDAFMIDTRSEFLGGLLKFVDFDGNCKSLLMELCAPNSKAAFEMSDDDSDEDAENYMSSDNASPNKQEPSPSKRWQFVQYMTKYQILRQAAIDCPRCFIELCDRISRDKNGEVLLQPLAHGDVHTILLRRIFSDDDNDDDKDSRNYEKIDAARAILAATRLSLRHRTSVLVSSSTEESEERIILPPGILLVRSKFKELLRSSGLDSLASMAIHQATSNLLQFHLLEILLECLDQDKLHRSFWLRAVHIFCIHRRGGLCSGLFLELWLTALHNQLVDDDTIAALAAALSKVNHEDPHIIALFAACHFASPHIQIPANFQRLLILHAASRFFHGPIDPFSVKDNSEHAIFQSLDMNQDSILQYAQALGFTQQRHTFFNIDSDDDSEPTEISSGQLPFSKDERFLARSTYRDDDYDSENIHYHASLPDGEQDDDDPYDDHVLIDDTDGLRPMSIDDDLPLSQESNDDMSSTSFPNYPPVLDDDEELDDFNSLVQAPSS